MGNKMTEPYGAYKFIGDMAVSAKKNYQAIRDGQLFETQYWAERWAEAAPDEQTSRYRRAKMSLYNQEVDAADAMRDQQMIQEFENKYPWYSAERLQNTAEGVMFQGAEGAMSAVWELGRATRDVTNLFLPEDMELEDYGAAPNFVPDSSMGDELVSTGAQFLTAFLPAQKALQGMGLLPALGSVRMKYLNEVAKNATAGGLSTFGAFDPAEANLANMLQEFGLNNDFIDYLSTDPGDHEISDRFKAAISGEIGGALLGEIISGGLKLGKFGSSKASELLGAASDQMRAWRGLERELDVMDQGASAASGVKPTSDNASGDAGLALPGSVKSQLDDGTQALPSQDSNLTAPSAKDTIRDTPSSVSSTSETEIELLSMNETSKRKNIQRINDPEKLHSIAQATKESLAKELQAVTKNIPDTEYYGVRVKEKEGLMAKINNRNIEPSTLSDYLGGRLVPTNMDSMKSVLKELRDQGRLIDEEDFLDNPKGGYRAIHLQIDMPSGVTAEVQLVPKPIADIQKDMHKIHDKWKNRTHTLTAEEAAERLKDREFMETQFNEKWQEFVNEATDQQ